MDEKFGQILLQANQLFMRCGIKSVTMDDIARELKVSKKTLYKYVKDKSDIVKQAITMHCSCEQEITNALLNEAENAIDELISITKHVSQHLQQIHPSIHFDLEKYYPEAWQAFMNHKEGHIKECISGNIERGIKQGLYRNNLNAEIIAKLYISKIDVVFDPAVFPISKFRFSKVHEELMRYHIRGIASPKGIKYLEDKVKKENLKL